MIFTTPQQLATYVRKKTKTNTTTFPDADIILYAAIWMDQISARVVDIDEDYFGAPQYADLVNSQREYPLPTDMLNHIKKVEAKLDGTNWINLIALDLTQYPRATDETTITSIFNNTEGHAYYDIYRGSIWLYSGSITGFAAGNQALKLWAYQWPTAISDLTSTTDISIDPNNTSAGFPRVLHLSLADAIVIAKKQEADKEYQLNDYEAAWEDRLHKALHTLEGLDFNQSYTGRQPEKKQLWDDGYSL